MTRVLSRGIFQHMPIDVEPRDLGSVVQLAAKSDGWKPEETFYELDPVYIGGHPDSSILAIPDQTPENLRAPLQAAWLATQRMRPNDHNGLKVAVNLLRLRDDGILKTHSYITDYFTAWGLPKATASRELFEAHEKQVVINRSADSDYAAYKTNIPWAVCTHNVLLDPNGQILMMVRSQSQGFNAGRVSVTEEEQMEPTLDISPFSAAFRSFHEELNLVVPPQTMRLLGVALEKGAAYPAYCFVAQTNELARNIEAKWRQAGDYNENTSLFALEMTEVDKWLGIEEVTADIWHKSFLAGDIAPDAKLKLHATSPWRISLVKAYSYIAS